MNVDQPLTCHPFQVLPHLPSCRVRSGVLLDLDPYGGTVTPEWKFQSKNRVITAWFYSKMLIYSYIN